MILTIDDDLDLNKIAESGQCFRMRQREDETDAGSWLLITGRSAAWIRQIGDDTFDIDCGQNEFDRVFRPYLDLDTNYRKIRESLDLDPFLKQAAEAASGLRILRQDLFETLITFILSQRKSIPAIRKNVEALCESYGDRIRDELYTFPEPQKLKDIPEDTYRAMGFGYRAPYVRDAALQAANGILKGTQDLDDDALLQRLMEIKGVGIKVASCTALFACHRLGLAPVDTWIQKVIDKVYQGTNPFPDYGPYAGLLQQYVFYWCIHGGKI